MGIKKTITDILNLLPIVKNRVIKSPGVYNTETDTTYTGGQNRSDTFNDSTDPFMGSDSKIYVEGKVVKNIKS